MYISNNNSNNNIYKYLNIKYESQIKNDNSNNKIIYTYLIYKTKKIQS